MTQSYPVRQNIYFARADKPNTTSIPSSFIGQPNIAFTIGTPQVLSAAAELGNDKIVNCGAHWAGPTSARPNPLTDADVQSLTGLVYFDTTISQAVVHDGVNWRNVFSGAVV